MQIDPGDQCNSISKTETQSHWTATLMYLLSMVCDELVLQCDIGHVVSGPWEDRGVEQGCDQWCVVG